MSRAAVYGAWQTLLAQAADFKVVEPRVRPWTKVDAVAEMPYLGATIGLERPQYLGRNNLPVAWSLQPVATIYVAVLDPRAGTARDALCAVLDKLELVLRQGVGAGKQQDLGLATVQWVKIDGDIITDEGSLKDGQLAAASVPFEIKVSGNAI